MGAWTHLQKRARPSLELLGMSIEKVAGRSIARRSSTIHEMTETSNPMCRRPFSDRARSGLSDFKSVVRL